MANWGHHIWDGVLHYRPGTSLCVQRHDLQRDQALHRRVIFLYALHALERHDGIQILGQYHGKRHNQQLRDKSTKFVVLHVARGSGIFRWLESVGVGSEGSVAGWRPKWAGLL